MAAAVRPVAVAPRRPIAILAPLAVVIAAILGMLAFVLLHGVTPGRTSALIGKPAPNFSFSTFDGRDVSLASLRGKPVMVNFWGSWCIPCKEEAPVLAEAWAKYQPAGVQFVGLAIWDQPAAARSFAQAAGATWLNGLDNDGKIAIDFGVYGVPESYFISAQGTLVDRYPGPFVGDGGVARLDQYLQRLLSHS